MGLDSPIKKSRNRNIIINIFLNLTKGIALNELGLRWSRAKLCTTARAFMVFFFNQRVPLKGPATGATPQSHMLTCRKRHSPGHPSQSHMLARKERRLSRGRSPQLCTSTRKGGAQDIIIWAIICRAKLS